MKKIIFILFTLAMIFVVFSCDEPKGTENTESTQTGTTSDNNTNTDTDNTTTDNNTNADNKDYIIQNPYEELEKTLTIKVNSIDEVEITESEWECYWELLDSAADSHSRITRDAGIIKVKNDSSIEYYDKGESYTYICNSIESYEEMKEFVYERMMPPDEDETIVFDDENLTIYFFYAGYKGNSTYDDFIIYRIEKFFNEDTSGETEIRFQTYKYSETTNRENSAYLFLIETESVSKTNPEDIDYDIEKYIFKKIK